MYIAKKPAKPPKAPTEVQLALEELTAQTQQLPGHLEQWFGYEPEQQEELRAAWQQLVREALPLVAAAHERRQFNADQRLRYRAAARAIGKYRRQLQQLGLTVPDGLDAVA